MKRWLATFAIAGMLPAVAVGQDASEYLEYRQASAEAFDHAARPPVKISSTTINDTLLRADITVQPWVQDNFITFIMAAPPGEITSASLYVEQLYDSDTEVPGQNTDATSQSQSFQREIPVTAKHLAWIRGNRIIKLNVPSVVPGTFGKRLKSASLTIAYAGDWSWIDDPAAPGSQNELTSIDSMLTELVANPTDLYGFAIPLEEVPQPDDNALVPLGGYKDAVARFDTTDEGFVSFTGADLASAGADLNDVALTSVTVWSNDKQVPIYSDDHWDDPYRPVQPDDTFILYARDQDSTYTAARTHWVRISTDAPDPMKGLMQLTIQPPSDAQPTAQHFMAETTVEQDAPPVLTKNDQFLTILGYRWVWFTWTPSGNGGAVPNPRDYQSTGSVSFDLEGLAANAADAQLHLAFYSHIWPKDAKPVQFSATLNGTDIGQFQVAEPEALDHVLTAPASALRAAGNTLVLKPETSATAAHLPELAFDRLTVSYPRTYAMTSSTLKFHPPAPAGGAVEIHYNPAVTTSVLVADLSGNAPLIIGSMGRGATTGTVTVSTEGPADRQYIALDKNSIPGVRLSPVTRATDLRATTNTADLLVISWPEFIPDLEPWVAARRTQGHAVTVVDVHDIYNQFGYGHLSPHAIREFIRYATLHWQGSQRGPAASTIVLVGDSTSAYRNEFRNDVINYVPTMRITDTTDPYASDQWFVNIFGDDHFADALIGRFSVNNRNDLQSLLSKQLAYIHKPAPGPWQNTLGFIADHSEFEESVDRVMRQAVPPRFFMDSIRMDDLPWIDNYYFPKDIADAREAKVSPVATRRIRDMFNNGASVVTYFGHGSPNVWSNERMWFGGDSPNSDNLLLTNRDRLPIVINMTCNSGAIDYPQPRWNICISEDFMRVSNGGAVACFVPSGPGLTVQHERLMMEIGRTLFGPDEQNLGHSMQLALWRYLAGGNPSELARMYILLGDPLLVPHIAGPLTEPSTTSASAPDWPGTVPLPGDVAAQKRGGAYQFKSYGDTVEPGAVSTFTSSTVALPLTAANSIKPRALAVSTTSADTTRTRSTVAPIDNLGAVKLVQWRRIDKPGISTTTATLQLRLRNDAPVPVLNLQVLASPAKGPASRSATVNLAPLGETNVLVEVPVQAGLNPLEFAVANSSKQHVLETATPPAVAGLRPDTERETLPPAVIDPRAVSIKYRESGQDVVASITCQVYITAAEPLSNLRIGIEDPSGAIVQPSIVTVPPVSPGEGTRVTLSVTLPANTTAADYKIRFDPSAFYPEFARFPAHPITLGSTQFADPQIVSVSPSDNHPTNGETVFFNVTVKNAGPTTVEGLKVQGYELAGAQQQPAAGQAQLLESKVNSRTPLINLDPGEVENVQLRWDPFQNPGENKLQFKVSSIYNMPDANLENNVADLTLDVRTKANIRFIEVGPLPLTAADQAARQIRFAARLKNEGETDATGLRIQFHAAKPRTPENLLGEADLESLKAGETKTVTLTYKLKPGEEHKPFQLSCEAHYKGSRQRISVD